MQAAVSLDGLLQAALAGDADARETLCEHLRVRFLPIAKRRVRQEDVEDVVQDALMIVHRKLGEPSRAGGVLIWSLAVLRNVVGNYYQSRRREGERREPAERLESFAVAGSAPDEAHAASKRAASLGAALAELARRTPRCGRIFEILLEQLAAGNAQECGRATWEAVEREFPEMTRNAFYVALHRCRERLREALASDEEGMAVQ